MHPVQLSGRIKTFNVGGMIRINQLAKMIEYLFPNFFGIPGERFHYTFFELDVRGVSSGIQFLYRCSYAGTIITTFFSISITTDIEFLSSFIQIYKLASFLNLFHMGQEIVLLF